jgi:hypothetical protein
MILKLRGNLKENRAQNNLATNYANHAKTATAQGVKSKGKNKLRENDEETAEMTQQKALCFFFAVFASEVVSCCFF